TDVIDEIDDKKDNIDLNSQDTTLVNNLTDTKQYTHIFNPKTLDITKFDKLRELQKEDPIYGNIIFYLENGMFRDNYSFSDNIKKQLQNNEYKISKNKYLVYKSSRKNRVSNNYRIVIPTELKNELILLYHNKYIHQGVNKLTMLIRLKYYWHNMYNDIYELVNKCEVLQKGKSGVHHKAHHTSTRHLQLKDELNTNHNAP